MRMYIFARTYQVKYLFIYIGTPVPVYVLMFVYMFVFTYLCIYMYLCMCVRIYVCMCICMHYVCHCVFVTIHVCMLAYIYEFFMGQFSVFATAVLRHSLSSCRIPHSNNLCSNVWFPFPHGQAGASLFLNLCRYDIKFPRPVTFVVRIYVKFIFVCSLSATVGKYSFVLLPFFVVSHYFRQFTLLFSSSSRFMVLFCILL